MDVRYRPFLARSVHAGPRLLVLPEAAGVGVVDLVAGADEGVALGATLKLRDEDGRLSGLPGG